MNVLAKPQAVVIPDQTAGVARGVRILFNFSRCHGPILENEGLPSAIREACREARVTVMDGKIRFRRYDDGTMNASADLAESHFGLGTYRAARHVSGEVNMCHERSDNTELAMKLVRCLEAAFKPEKSNISDPIQWASE